VSQSREWWDAELERVILEHYRKSFREWWAKQCIDYRASSDPGAEISADVASAEISHKLPTNAGG
jgi:hypothetical protein